MSTLTTKHQRLAALRPLSPESVASLAAAWDVRMVYESNSIEGNSLTLRETEIVLSKGVTVSGKPLKDHLEVLNLKIAWDRIKVLSQSSSHLRNTDLLHLHRELMTRVGDDTSTGFRDYFARPSNSNHVPAKAVEVPGRLSDLLIDLHQFSDPIERAARLHHGITRIFPFNDGNGLIARLAMNFVLLAAGYPPISIPVELRQNYYNALEAADSGDFQTWRNFLTDQLNLELDQWLSALDPSSLITDH